MIKLRRISLMALTLILASTTACAATTISRRSWTAARAGRVEAIHEDVRNVRGEPAAGAVAGAIVGGLVGGALTGRRSGAFAGAAGGAIIGAAASDQRHQIRTYEVVVRFDDGGSDAFRYRSYPPFRPGQRVTLTPRGLVAGRVAARASPPRG